MLELGGPPRPRKPGVLNRKTGRSCGRAPVDGVSENHSPNRYTTEHNENFGQVAFTIDAKPAHPIHLNKYMVYHMSNTTSSDEMARRVEWTLDRVVEQGFLH
jgi:hypothetical protein